MRTIIDISDGQYPDLMSRARASGLALPLLVQQFIEGGLRSPAESNPSAGRHSPPPVIVPARGVPIPTMSHEEIWGAEEEDDACREKMP